MSGAAGQHDDGTGWIRLQLFVDELFASPDVEDPGYHRIDAILWVAMGHQLDGRMAP
jgi:hypothetical protein